MKVKFWDPALGYKEIKEEIDTEMQSVLGRGDLILRGDVEIFEKKLAKYIGTKYAIGVNSGTDALFLSLKVVGVKEGDQVITVSHTFIATIEAIIRCGAKPILVDIRDDYLMDMDEVGKIITYNTRAIMPVHLS